MNSKMGIEPSSPLSRTLSNAAFREYHCAVIDSSVDNVWVALHDLRWLDLTAARPLLLARGFGIAGLMRAGCLEMFMLNGASEESAPRRFTVVMVGKPWSPACPAKPPKLSLDVILVTVALPLLPGVPSLTRRSSTHRTGAACPGALYWQLTRSDRFISQVGSGARLTRAFTAHQLRERVRS